MNPDAIPTTLRSPGAGRFWLAVLLTGIGAGLGAAALTLLLQTVQHFVWGGSGSDLVTPVIGVSPMHRILALFGAGLVTMAGQLVLKKLTNANGIDVAASIWLFAGRLPAVRTVGSALLSVIIVGMGVSLGREGAPKQVGAVLANLFSERGRLSDEQRKLLVACGAGAGMAAAYGVPIGGALFAIEVLRGVLALRFVLPALFTSGIACGVAWLFLPDAPTYRLPSFPHSPTILLWACLAGPIAGVCSVGYVRAVTWVERHRPEGWKRLVAPVFALTLIGVASARYPYVLGNGKDLSQLAFDGSVGPGLLLLYLFLRPAAMLASVGSGAPGGLFTPSLTFGAMLGGCLGWAWGLILPGPASGLYALLGAGAVLAATTQGPISTVILLMELTARDRSVVMPLLIVVGLATLVARSIEPRSIYDARLTDDQLAARMQARDRALLTTG